MKLESPTALVNIECRNRHEMKTKESDGQPKWQNAAAGEGSAAP
jgi:hypothetical protein